MTPEGVDPVVWERAVAWARRMADAEDECGEDIGVGGGLVEMKKFPRPDTDGLSAEERERALADWRAAVQAFRRGQPAPARESA